MPSYEYYEHLSRYSEASGTISAQGESVEVVCEGTGSGVVSIKGTFTGKLRFYGLSTELSTAEGGRIAFASGVGSLGTNVIENTGDAWDVEFRVVTDGHKLVVVADEWTSGTATVDISVSDTPSITFINGPVHTAEEEAVRDKRAYLVDITGTQLPASDELAFIIKNPANSGYNLMLTDRLFASNSPDPLEYVAYVNPTITLANSATPINRYLGADANVMEFTYEVGDADTLVMGGIQGSSQPIPYDNTTVNRELLAVIPPNNSLGFLIKGAGNNITNAARVWATLQWYVEKDYI